MTTEIQAPKEPSYSAKNKRYGGETHFYINYSTSDDGDGWIEFNTKVDRDHALKQLEAGPLFFDLRAVQHTYFTRSSLGNSRRKTNDY